MRYAIFSISALLPLIRAQDAPAPTPGGVFQVTMFKGVGFTGEVLRASAVVGQCTNLPESFNDLVKSVSVDDGVDCFIYNAFDCQGFEGGPINTATNQAHSDLSNFPIFDNAVSSFRCELSRF
ncbi:hypothetical protein EJ04DRAFT_567811 [Polyplosphaeria fusca]|uniref:Uncharacterized protein n=1 Tax=Polyplosphaeria fusca TaxID=682080 RepID=A0A9P4UXJ0_9PLEO|nr:hypothetical protein EJ04DRAFT_567811 [Polyplosphaeria fusca]